MGRILLPIILLAYLAIGHGALATLLGGASKAMIHWSAEESTPAHAGEEESVASMKAPAEYESRSILMYASKFFNFSAQQYFRLNISWVSRLAGEIATPPPEYTCLS